MENSASAPAQAPHLIPDSSVVPENGLLLHVGVFKTGTTALQEALRAADPQLVEQGVLYRGPYSWEWKTLLGLMNANRPGGPWQRLEQDVQGHGGRVMVSSENLCGATPDEAKRVVELLGAGRPVTVLITIRSLSGLLASTWQQLLKRGMHQPFQDWLEQVFDNVGSPEIQFWRRNDFPAQVRKWGSLVGEDNVILAVSDKNFPTRNLELVEDLLTVPRGTVELRPDTRSNRSMSFAEAELLRRVNEDLEDRLTKDSYRKLVRLGTFPAMYKTDTGADEPIPLPRWAADAASEIGRRQAEDLRASRAVLIGDVSALADSKWDVDGPVPEPTTINLATAVAAVNGALLASQRDLKRQAKAESDAKANGRQRGTVASGAGRIRGLLKRP